MKCNYIIKNPVGEDIIIPADFGLLNNNEDLRKVFEFTTEKDVQKLTEHISKEIEGSLSERVISNIVSQNIANLDSIVHEINEAIPQSGEYLSFEKALYKYFLTNPKGLDNAVDSLNEPLSLDYFNGVSGVLNQTSLSEQHSQIKADMGNLQEFGIYADALVEMDKFLEALKHFDKNNYNSNTLLANKSILGVFSTNVENYTIYNDGDMFSLFMGLFKRIGSSLDPEIMETNFGSTDYFTNNIIEGEVQLTMFENDIINNTEASRKKIRQAIELISEGVTGDDSLVNIVLNLFNYLNPKKALDNQNRTIVKTSNYLKNERAFETAFQADSYNRFLESVEKDLDDNYSVETTHWRDKNSFLENNLSIGRDLVFFSEIGEFALLTEYQSQSDGKVIIRGLKREGVNNTYVTQTLNKADPLVYRTYETIKNPVIEGENVAVNENLVQISSPIGFKENVLKNLLRKGDTILDGWVVEGIYPTYVRASHANVKGMINTPYSDIDTFATSAISQSMDASQWDSLNTLEIIKNTNDLTKGDKIKDPYDNNAIKSILWTTDENVYVERDGWAEAIPRNKVEAARSYSDATLDRNEINTALREASAPINYNSNYSRFTNPRLATEGDYFVTKEGAVGYIVDSDTGKSILMTNDVKTVHYHRNLNVANYLSSKPLISKHTPISLRVNNALVHINTSDAENTNNLRKAVYMVPNTTTLKSMYLFPNNHANVGQWVESGDHSTKGVKDVTHHMLKLMSQKLKIKESDINPHIEIVNEAIQKDLTGIEEILNFSTLTTAVKESLNPIKEGVQFRLYEYGGISSDIYTVSEVRGSKIVTEVSKTTKKGSIVTDQKIFDLNTLLAEKTDADEYPPHNSISNLYLRVGNPEQMVIAQVIERDLSIAELERKNSIETLKKEMTKTFARLDIAVTEDVEGFQAGQKAKITSNLDGEVKIVLNTANGEYSDLVHENLHIYLTLLRYNNLEEYVKLIDTLADNDRFTERFGDSDTLYNKEEFVVDELVRLSNGENNFLYSNLVSFMKGIAVIMEKHFGETYKFNISEGVTNPIAYLKTPMRTFYNINKRSAKHPLYNMGILAAEPFLREWMKKENIKIIC